MLRWTISFVIAVSAIGSVLAADLPNSEYRPGAGVYRKAPQPYRRGAAVEEDPDLLFTPSDGTVPYIAPPMGTPLLPGSATLPGYYGSSHSYNYQGPYYGGPYVGPWNRLPYACGVYGYC